ncbi:MAG: ATPase [Cyanobacteria bacterium QH_8_48_120]|jgi:predicted ABC-class ATPase|nr:MAG: ATPase [Cyanobacteria bacterium QH_1_48_107]PSO55911.1 MAG: ATPase [Cyanobacteria bacterium QH_10_48_56]PSO64351.1 MAG: ATPase [Cyanobacteria bacterium QH_2_48_84]PSO66863.1 MAG: ATPase [Cyanobacteria bacterium QH_7_48_89]PSO68922.1 MAG: ATPase [Cyanobacteria bacterium QH_6_48_35]PSO71366.1 MAG: ATPase [Cyanobacteria bacterium QH_3_48_40]PSO75166.1 MAG: ATPase [Cyanobacteria bacterium QS_1_48_34]PSO75622.1 MAG: ATPase [Cyanobacteria bacterium QH_8_48_120]PSP04314.1 MAG: ATPase [Cyan
MPNQEKLRSTLQRLDNNSYKAYKDIKGSYDFTDFTLIIDYVQGDPFAAPSQLRVQVPQSVAGFSRDLYNSRSREVALRDYLTRQFDKAAQEITSSRGTGKSGLIAIARVGQEVIDRTSVLVNEEFVEARFVVGLPAKGRKILGRQAADMLCEDIPDIVDEALIYQSLTPKAIRQHVETVEDADWLRQQLGERGLVAFVPDGAILPRRSGVDDRPLQEDNVVPFQSPEEQQVTFNCPNRGEVTGMGIPAGVTLIVGGGYHGKSTLLRAVEVGVYNHIPDDGRELVVTDPGAVKIRAEDGRSIAGVDISAFINQLPQGRSTTNFSTPNASGSTSQAANIIEALEAVAKLLLVDEDTAATNFMIRDRRMQQLVSKDKEPITPFIDKIRQLYIDYEVSTILVMGGSGDYFDMADTAIAMDNFQPYEVTEKAKAIAAEYATERTIEGGTQFGKITPRVPLAESIDPSSGKKAVKTKVRDEDEISFGSEDIDLAAVEQIVDTGQLRAIAAAIVYAKREYLDKNITIPEILDRVMADIDADGLDAITTSPQGDLAEFRRFELAAALNRLRTLKVR